MNVYVKFHHKMIHKKIKILTMLILVGNNNVSYISAYLGYKDLKFVGHVKILDKKAQILIPLFAGQKGVEQRSKARRRANVPRTKFRSHFVHSSLSWCQ